MEFLDRNFPRALARCDIEFRARVHFCYEKVWVGVRIMRPNVLIQHDQYKTDYVSLFAATLAPYSCVYTTKPLLRKIGH